MAGPSIFKGSPEVVAILYILCYNERWMEHFCDGGLLRLWRGKSPENVVGE